MGRVRPGIASAALLPAQAADVPGGAAHGAEIANTDVDVLGRDVRALEAVDEPAHRLEQLRRLVLPPGDDHRLPASEPGLRDRRLERHAARQPEDVGERRGLALVGPEPHPAERRPERRVVHGDERNETGRVVLRLLDPLVPGDGDLGEPHEPHPVASRLLDGARTGGNPSPRWTPSGPVSNDVRSSPAGDENGGLREELRGCPLPHVRAPAPGGGWGLNPRPGARAHRRGVWGSGA